MPMSAQPSHTPAAGQAAEHLRPQLRMDLVVRPVAYEGVTHYVVKDPIALKYFRFKQEEYYLLRQMDGRTPLQDVKRRFESEYKPQTITMEDLSRFASQLHEAGIVLLETPEQAKVLVKRRRKKTWKKVGQFFTNILFIKIPLIDPERLLTWMYPYFRWMFTRTFVTLSFGVMLAALTLVATQFDTFYSKLPSMESFFNWWTLFYFWISLAVVKVIHEFGHGLTAKHFGGEVHEMGALLLVFTPALYCDVTDSWLLPNKWHRIWISAAGIFVECLLAAIATFVWWNTEDGVLNRLMMSTMFICSVNTILFNANPLLRYDGYYVMSDWLEIPNLRIKSTQFFAYLIQDKVLGLELPVQSYLPRSRRTLFVSYAVLSYLYRWFITFSILFFLYHFLKPYGLQSISATLAVLSLIPLLFMPLFKILKWVRTPGRLRKMKKKRAAAYAIGFVALVALVLSIRTPLRVQGALVLTPAGAEKIYVEVPGQLVDFKVRDGDRVEPGTLLATLRDLNLLRETMRLQQERDVTQVRYEHFSSINDNWARGLAQNYRKYGEDLDEEIDKVNQRMARLNLVSNREGRVIGLPPRDLVGRYLEPGMLCEVGDPKQLEAHLILDQSDLELIDRRATAWVKIYGKAERTYKSYVSEIAQKNRDEIQPELSVLAGGEIATVPDARTGAAKPVNAMFEVVIPIDNSDLALQPGQRGFAKIDAGSASLGWWLWRMITQTFHFAL